MVVRRKRARPDAHDQDVGKFLALGLMDRHQTDGVPRWIGSHRNRPTGFAEIAQVRDQFVEFTGLGERTRLFALNECQRGLQDS